MPWLLLLLLLLVQVFRASGFKVTKGSGWHVLWGSLAPPELLAGVSPWQRHNHFPGTWELGRKDRLYRNIAAAARRTRNPAAFGFVPKFFILPADLEEFKLDLAQNPRTTYIRKPVASSRGRGVRIVTDPHALDAAALTDVILQHYIPNPLLIGGRKFDLRVYVAVTSLDPLRVYVYKEGLVRFASEQYSSSKSSLKQATMHLTNYSINKKAPHFKQPSGGSNTAAANKWGFGQLAEHLEQQGHDWQGVWQQVCSIVAHTLIATEPALSAATRSAGGPVLLRSCFEVFGFDVLLDAQLRAWLLEVNTCPALNADSPLDMGVKTNMVSSSAPSQPRCCLAVSRSAVVHHSEGGVKLQWAWGKLLYFFPRLLVYVSCQPLEVSCLCTPAGATVLVCRWLTCWAWLA
ncbi:tubulin-tyrosine ligase family-domain-containing protein [Scenedesmus sp. NREL 46B-D3]|nr:tubulin-tyrosine ligase family-domain-containing protein [Scenedesmus sp. NREL 46B-D3]